MVLSCYRTHKVKAGCQIRECDTGLTVTRSLRLNMILPRNLSCVQENCLQSIYRVVFCFLQTGLEMGVEYLILIV